MAALYGVNSVYYVEGQEVREAPVIRNNINSDPDTWVASATTGPPPGVTAAQWPLDDNADVYPIPIQRYAQGVRWDFAEFARLWQFALDWAGPATVITDEGIAYPLYQISATIDLAVDPLTRRRHGLRICAKAEPQQMRMIFQE